MRFERHGGAPDLQAASRTLVSSLLHGRALDDNQAEEAAAGEFPDFACFRDLLLIEMKHLETDQQDRIGEIFEAKIDPAEKPVFYGSRESHLIMDSLSNGETINTAVASKLGRTIETILSKANRQFRSYRARHPRKNSVSICAILNSARGEWSPDVVIHAVHGKMKMTAGEPRFAEIDVVLYISEKHFQTLADGRPAPTLVIYQNRRAVNQPWKMQFVERVVDGWSRMRTGDAIIESTDRNFETVQDIPKSMSQSEVWQLEYQRDPYLRTLSIDRLRMMFHRTHGRPSENSELIARAVTISAVEIVSDRLCALKRPSTKSVSRKKEGRPNKATPEKILVVAMEQRLFVASPRLGAVNARARASTRRM